MVPPYMGSFWGRMMVPVMVGPLMTLCTGPPFIILPCAPVP